MNKYHFQIVGAIILMVATLMTSSCKKNQQPDENWLPPADSVNGKLTTVSGIKMLTIWGTSFEQGYAYGYLLGPDIVKFFNDAMGDNALGISAEDWNEVISNHLQKFTIPTEYTEEIEGIMDGMKARNSDQPVFITGLNRNITLNDLIALNCDLIRISCSSFSAWGDMTSDGSALTGRNMDYAIIPSFLRAQLIVVRIPEERSGKMAWISINWPGDLGCTTGMNEKGVTIAQQDVNVNPVAQSGFTPDNYIHRMMIEHATPDSMEECVTAILQTHYSAFGAAPMISRPFPGAGKAALVPEFDGVVNVTNGFTIRLPEVQDQFIIATNHFRMRHVPTNNCWRYNLLSDMMIEVKTGIRPQLTPGAVCDILKETPIPGLICAHSVVYEPNALIMTVAFTNGTHHAPDCKYITIDLKNCLTIHRKK